MSDNSGTVSTRAQIYQTELEAWRRASAERGAI